jgi:hypothetical protein
LRVGSVSGELRFGSGIKPEAQSQVGSQPFELRRIPAAADFSSVVEQSVLGLVLRDQTAPGLSPSPRHHRIREPPKLGTLLEQAQHQFLGDRVEAARVVEATTRNEPTAGNGRLVAASNAGSHVPDRTTLHPVCQQPAGDS